MTAPTILPSRAAIVAWLADTAERVARTFVQAFLAVFVPLLPVPGTTVHWDTLQKAAAAGVVAGVAAVLAFLTALLARWSGNPATASFVRSDVIDVVSEPVKLEPLVGTLQAQQVPVVEVHVHNYGNELPVKRAGAVAKRVGKAAHR